MNCAKCALYCAKLTSAVDISRSATDAPRVATPDRRDRLLAALRSNGRASVADLAADLGVTAATIRRDLQQLATQGRLVRTYGGAALMDRPIVRDAETSEAKRAIAQMASHLVTEGSTIAIGSGTTTLEF